MNSTTFSHAERDDEIGARVIGDPNSEPTYVLDIGEVRIFPHDAAQADDIAVAATELARRMREGE
jgi:hypothetical protein